MCKNSINLTFNCCQNWCAELMFFLNPIVLSLKSSLQKRWVRTELVGSDAYLSITSSFQCILSYPALLLKQKIHYSKTNR